MRRPSFGASSILPSGRPQHLGQGQPGLRALERLTRLLEQVDRVLERHPRLSRRLGRSLDAAESVRIDGLESRRPDRRRGLRELCERLPGVSQVSFGRPRADGELETGDALSPLLRRDPPKRPLGELGRPERVATVERKRCLDNQRERMRAGLADERLRLVQFAASTSSASAHEPRMIRTSA